MSPGALGDVAAQLAAEGGLLADVLLDAATIAAAPAPLGAWAARGPRSAGREDAVAAVVEAVYEGWRAHAHATGVADARPRILATDDRDLALLAGDRLYALGLARLAQVGDLESITQLTDVIALCAVALAEGRDDLAHAGFEAGAVGVGWGRHEPLEQAKRAAREGAPDAAQALRAAARQVGGEMAPAHP